MIKTIMQVSKFYFSRFSGRRLPQGAPCRIQFAPHAGQHRRTPSRACGRGGGPLKQDFSAALNYFAYNFIKIHRTLRMSPAMAAGVPGRLWSVEDLVAL